MAHLRGLILEKNLKENRRRLYSLVVHSVLLYAAPVWADEFRKSKAKKELTELWNLQKQIGIRVISPFIEQWPSYHPYYWHEFF